MPLRVPDQQIRAGYEIAARLSEMRQRIGGGGRRQGRQGKDQNDNAVKNGDDRILAAYKNSGPKAWKIWIITEWDRSYTTILFPDEY